MTRVITVTGGFTGTAVVDLTDSLKGLSGAAFKMALAPVGQDDPPDVNDPAWVDGLGGTPGADKATVGIPVDDNTPVGYYNVALDVVAGGRHEVVWVMDRRNRRSRALVYVT